MFRIPGARAASYYLLRRVALPPAPNGLRCQAPEQPNLRQMRPGIEVIGRQDLELDKAGRGRRQFAFLVTGLEQKPVRQLALADRTERSLRALVAGQHIDLFWIVVVAAADQDGELVKPGRLLVLEGIDGIGVGVGPNLDLDPIVLLATCNLAPFLAGRRQQLPAFLWRQQVDVTARGG